MCPVNVIAYAGWKISGILCGYSWKSLSQSHLHESSLIRLIACSWISRSTGGRGVQSSRVILSCILQRISSLVPTHSKGLCPSTPASSRKSGIRVVSSYISPWNIETISSWVICGCKHAQTKAHLGHLRHQRHSFSCVCEIVKFVLQLVNTQKYCLRVANWVMILTS